MHPLAPLRRDERGSVTVEAALLVPLVLVMFVLAADVVRYVETATRMEHVAAVAADITARNEAVIDRVDFRSPRANNELATFFRVANEAAAPDDLAARGRVYISAVAPSGDGGHTLLWRRTGPYLLDADSRLDALPPLPTTGNFIVAEVIYAYEPLLLGAPGLAGLVPTVIYRTAVFRPRLTALASLEPAGG